MTLQPTSLLGSSVLRRSRLTPLALAFAAVFTASSGAHANTLLVTSCTDNGPLDTANLRNSIAAAVNMDTIDLTTLTACMNSRISLTLGQLAVTQNNLKFMGPPFNVLTIDGAANGSGGMFHHSGTGQLGIYNLTLNHGTVGGAQAKGGCIYSAGYVNLSGANVYNCTATTTSGQAYGGAIYSKLGAMAKYSVISGNTAIATSSGTAIGGGLFLKTGGLGFSYSSLIGNTATGPGDNQGIEGGAYIIGAVMMRNSTISGNVAHAHTGGMFVGGTGYVFSMMNSTVSGNTATKGPIGGMFISATTMLIDNSTIAFNSAGLGTFPGGGSKFASGLATYTGSLQIRSTLIANNGYGVAATQDDFTLGTATLNPGSATNLIRSSLATLPVDTLRNVCPVLGPLRNNGRSTKTHALLSHSPAIDHGGNQAGNNQDQRGHFFDTSPFPFPRVSNFVADIGAYEVEQNDVVFNTSFEGCPP